MRCAENEKNFIGEKKRKETKQINLNEEIYKKYGESRILKVFLIELYKTMCEIRVVQNCEKYRGKKNCEGLFIVCIVLKYFYYFSLTFGLDGPIGAGWQQNLINPLF